MFNCKYSTNTSNGKCLNKFHSLERNSSAKLGVGLWSGKYSGVSDNSLDSDSTGISPVMFKNLIAKNHKEFSTKLQQDAQEFLLHVINELERHSRNDSNPADALKFTVEDRVECCASGKVKYTKRDEYCLPLHIPLQMATNADEVRAYDEKVNEAEASGQKIDPNLHVRPRITLQNCLDRFGQTEIVDQYYSSAINGQTTAKKMTRLATMPDYMILHLKKFTLREDWSCVKLDVSVDIPDVLDLSALRSTGLQPNEELLPDLDTAPPQPEFDSNVVAQLTDMGFPLEACKRALFYTKNSGLEPATQWIMEHIADSDFGDPFVPPGTAVSANTAFVADPTGLEMLMGMGFTVSQATKALKETNNNIERAADWIFSHQMEIENWVGEVDNNEVSGNASAQSQQHRDGDSREYFVFRFDNFQMNFHWMTNNVSFTFPFSDYKLVAFISHMGSSSQVGHYVCHILKNDKWVIFNDSKVAISQNPPKDLGYLYLYQRL